MHEASLLSLATADAAQAWRYSADVHAIVLWEPAVHFLDAHGCKIVADHCQLH